MEDTTVKNPMSVHISTLEKVLELIVLSVILVTSLAGNFSLWVAIVGTPDLQTISNCLVLYMSGSCILITLYSSSTFYFVAAGGNEDFPELACDFLGVLMVAIFMNSFFAFGLVSFNRYVLVCHPTKYRTLFSKANIGLLMTGRFEIVEFIFHYSLLKGLHNDGSRRRIKYILSVTLTYKSKIELKQNRSNLDNVWVIGNVMRVPFLVLTTSFWPL